MRVILLIVVFSCSAFATQANPENDAIYDDYDGFDLIYALIRDQKLEGAERLLLSNKQNLKIDQVSYLRAKINFSKEEWAAALKKFEEAEQITKNISLRDDVLNGVADSAFELKEYSKCSRAWAKLSFDGRKKYSHQILKEVQCLRESGKLLEAFQKLETQNFRNKQSLAFVTEELRTLLRLTLTQESKQRALAFLQSQKSFTPWINIAEIFGEYSFKEIALEILELAKLRFPANVELQLATLVLYQEKMWNRSIERGLELAHIYSGNFGYHVAEMHRLRSSPETSYFWQLQNDNDLSRRKQKIALAIEQEKWNFVSTNDFGIVSSSDDELNYAIGYSKHAMGDFASAKKYFDQLQVSSFKMKAAQIQKLWEQ